MLLSRSFSVAEFEYSETASRRMIDNTMPDHAIDNAKRLCSNLLQPLRDRWMRPIIITSGYRSPELNKAVRGARTSQHIQGLAVDIRVNGWSPIEVCERIKNSGLPFDQLILEFGAWCHVSWSDRCRQSVLTAYKSPITRRTKYVQGLTTEYFA